MSEENRITINCSACGKTQEAVYCEKCTSETCKVCSVNRDGHCLNCNEEKLYWFDYFIKSLGRIIMNRNS